MVIANFLNDAKKILRDENIVLTLVDIGSRNGIIELEDLAEFTQAYGFEPNPDEYDKLVSGRTDVFLITGKKPPPYKTIAYYPYAITNKNTPVKFYITKGPGAAGLLEPAQERLREVRWKGKTYADNFWSDIFAGYKMIEVEGKTLDSFAGANSIRHIDYLKVDVEGAEYEVFEGAKEILRKTGVIKAETCFIPFRKGQKLFSHVDLFLRDLGFDLLKYEVVQAQIGYKARTKPVQYLPANQVDPYGQPLSCDAIYVNRGITDPKRIMAQAIVLIEKGYVDEGLHILKTKTAFKDTVFIEKLEQCTIFGTSAPRKVRALAYCVIDAAVDTAKKAYRAVCGRKY